jgi:hypothetical protein
MKTRLLLLSFIFWFVSLRAAEPLSGTVTNQLKGIDLGDSVTFAVVAKPKSDRRHWQLSQKLKTSESRISSGYDIGPNERLAYFWVPDSRTLWVATSKVVEKTVLFEGLKKGTGGIYGIVGYENIPDLPADFKTAIADLLAGK